jgi:tryptophan 7-halogenase
MIENVVVLGGGSAGFMAALALKVRLPQLRVTVIRSKDIGIIGVGEGSTVGLAVFLHEHLRVAQKKFFDVAQPTWKLGLRFIWGPRAYFNYTFATGPEARIDVLPKPIGVYCDADMEYADSISALMTLDKAFPRLNGLPDFRVPHSYHFENEKYVRFLEGYAAALGVEVLEDTVEHVKQDDRGVAGLALRSGREVSGDLYVDASGFISLLLGKTLGEPFVSFKDSLFCDRAVVGGWDRQGSPDPEDQVIKPYTTCETMDSGWCWQIEHETRINRGYVYCASFITDEEAEREFREKNPKVGPTRVVRFVSGRYGRNWVKNVVGIGNASGFVEPLEATALGVIAMQSHLLASTLAESDLQPSASQVAAYNGYHVRNWESVRAFIAIHYKFNTRLDTPFWRECLEKTDVAGAEPFVEYYRENGPSKLWAPILLDGIDSFQTSGYATLLLGQKVPFRRTHVPGEKEMQTWEAHRRKVKENAARGVSVREALESIRSPKFKWTAPPGARPPGAF